MSPSPSHHLLWKSPRLYFRLPRSSCNMAQALGLWGRLLHSLWLQPQSRYPLPAVLIPGLPSPLWSRSSGFHRLCSFPALNSLGIADSVFCPRPHLAQRSNDIRAEMKAASATAAPGNWPAEMLSAPPQEVPRGKYRPSQFSPLSVPVVFQLFRCPGCRVQSPRSPPLLPAPLRTSPGPSTPHQPSASQRPACPPPHLATSAPLAASTPPFLRPPSYLAAEASLPVPGLWAGPNSWSDRVKLFLSVYGQQSQGATHPGW